MICFADLKKYKFTYLFGFPALHSETPWNQFSYTNEASNEDSNLSGGYPDRRRTILTSDEATALVDGVQTWRYSIDARQYGFFLAKKMRGQTHQTGDEEGAVNSKDAHESDKTGHFIPATPVINIGFSWTIASLVSYEEGFFNDIHPDDCYICFADPSTHDVFPGWMLRNLLVLVHRRWNLRTAQILCYRDVPARRHEARSIVLRVELPSEQFCSGVMPRSPNSGPPKLDLPKITGWERNNTGKVTSKIANLGEYMDPLRYSLLLSLPLL